MFAQPLRHKKLHMHYQFLRRLSFSLFILLTTATIAIGSDLKNISIKGLVTTADNKPAENVLVSIQSLKKSTLTNESGLFEFTYLDTGTYTLEIHLTGYKTIIKDVIVTDNNTAEVNFQLKISQQQLLNEVVIEGSKNKYKEDKISASLRLNEPLKEIPQNIEVISRKIISDQQIISMSDGVIRNVSGATRLEHWGDMYTRINMRGSQIAAFRNGMNVVNSAWGPLTEDMSFVDHIEFVKGPAGFMMANGDPAGLYNVVTKKPTGIGFNGSAEMTLGSFDLYRATVDLDGKFDKAGKFLYRLNLMDQAKGSFRPNEFNDRYSIAPVLAYKVDDKTTLTFEYTLQHATMSNVGSYYIFSAKGYGTLPRESTMLPAGIDPTRISDHSAFLNLQHHINKHWKFTAQLAYLKYNQVGSSMWPSSVDTNGNIIRNVSIWDATSGQKLGQAFINGDAQTGFIHHRILGGVDMGTKNYYADWSQAHDLDSAGAPFNVYAPNLGVPNNGYSVFDRSISLEQRAIAGYGTISQRYTGLYLQDELGVLKNILRLTLAGRYTYVSQSSYGGAPETAKHFTPRVGLSASIDKNTSVYALYDQAFTPQAGILRYGGDIKPLTGNNIEAGVKRDWIDGRWNTTLSVYRILKNNELTTDPANTASEQYSVVLGQKQAQGIEFDMKGEIVKGLNLIINYAYTDAKVTEVTAGIKGVNVGDRIPGFAKHNINTWVDYRIQRGALKGFGINAGFSYQADRDTWTWGTAGQEKLPDYFRLDGGLSWEGGRFRAAANVFNILNTYLYSGGYYGYGLNAYYWQAEAPTNYRLSVAYKF